MFGGMTGPMGWLFFGFGMLFMWPLASHANLPALWQFRGELATAEAEVTACEETNFSVNDVEVHRIRYRFEAPDGREYVGEIGLRGETYDEGERIAVEYPAGSPGVSRIAGGPSGPVEPWILLIVGVFPLAGAGLVAWSAARGVKANRLLTHGRLGRGVLVSRTPTSTRINNRTVWKLTFEFTAADGETYNAVARTHETGELEDDAEEPILYHPFDPSYAVLFDSLSGSPEIDEAGQLRTGSVLGSLVVLAIPTIVVLGHAAFVYFYFFA
jgi:hypothetical protein